MILGIVLLALGIGSTPVAETDQTTCELHVWPTKQFGAVFHGATGVWNGYGATLNMYLSPMDTVASKLGASITDADQEAQIRSIIATPGGRFSDYRLIFHPSPSAPKHGNWIAKNVGEGGRDSDSLSSCYAEMHVVFITLFRTAISKKIQTGFLYREFGASPTMTRKAVDAGSTGAAGFTSNGDLATEAGKADLVAAFRENVAVFMRSRKMR